MAKPLRVLIVEDSPSDAELTVRELRRAGYEPQSERVETEPDFLEKLKDDHDIILSDYSMPQFDGVRALRLLRERGLDTPFILVSGTMGEETAVAAMKEGASDYLLKDRLARLGPAVAQALEQSRLRRERAQAGEALRESEERFRQIAENIEEVFWVTDPAKDRILYVSPGYELIWGRRCADIYDSPKSWMEAIHPADRPRIAEAALTKQIAGTYDEEYRVVRPDGSIRSIHDRAFPVRDSGGEVYRVVGVARDVTERRRSEEVIRASEERFASFMDNLPGFAWIKDKERRYAYANKTLRQMVMRARDWFGKTDAEIWPAEIASVYEANDEEVIANRAPKETIEPLLHADEQRTALVSKFPILDGEGEVAFICGIGIDITERLQAEQRIREQANIIHRAHDAIIIRDLDDRIQFWNQGAERLYGWTALEVLGHNIVDTFYVRPEEYAAAKKWLLEKGEWSGELLQNCKSGRQVAVDCRWTLVRDEAGEPKSVLAINADVTKRKEADEALRRQEKQYRILFASHPNPTWVYDADTLAFLAVNDAAIEHYGYTREEFLAMTLFDIRPEEDHTRLAEMSQSRTDEPRHVGVWRHRKKTGEIILADVYASRTEFEGRPARLALSIDVTDRERTQERLREQAEIINRAHDAIIMRDFETKRITFWNHGAENLYGWTAEEAIGSSIGELIFENPEQIEPLTKTLISTGEFRGEVRQVAKDKKELIVEGRATLIRKADGSPHSVLIINTDITEHKKLETQLLRAQRLESIGTLASGVAHDLNNILAPILMGAAVLRRTKMESDDEAILSTIETCAQRGADIVRQVLTFARGAEGDRLNLMVAPLLKDVAKIAQETFPKKIAVRTRLAHALWSVMGDPTQLHQVLLNLSVNARDAMPAGGTLTLAVENFPVDEHYASMMPGAKAGPHVCFEVTDTGMGIPPQNIDKIFDPFFTTKELGHGTGLGLSSVLGIVKSHGGFMSVYSEVGRGTTFKVYLPATVNETETLKETPDASSPVAQGELLLLVDDEQPIRQVAEALLQGHGYQVLTASDATEALAIFATRKDDIKLVLTDLAMPMMDGIALIRILQKLKPDVRVIASTGRGGQEQHSEELEELNVHACLTKPYNKNKLLKTLHDALHPNSDYR